MENIKRWFENDCNNYEFIEYDDDYLEARTDIVLYVIVSPHSGTDNKWMLRVSTISAFDRWANSTAIEKFFETDIELCHYLHIHQLDIYKDLIKYLSGEYEELSMAYEEAIE